MQHFRLYDAQYIEISTESFNTAASPMIKGETAEVFGLLSNEKVAHHYRVQILEPNSARAVEYEGEVR